MTVKYIILRNSVEQAAWDALTTEQKAVDANFQGKKFRVIFGGFKPRLRKTDSYNDTVGGKIDKSVGSIFFEGQYLIRVAREIEEGEPITHLGTSTDLENYFLLNKPNPTTGNPSDVITLVDHYGVEHTGFLAGDHTPEPLTTQIDGSMGWFFVSINFLQKDAVAA